MIPHTTALDSFSDQKLAHRLQQLRISREWSLDHLAEATGISRATLSRFERAQTSPTASQLGRLCTTYAMTMSQLLSGMDRQDADFIPADAQILWRDQSNGFQRRAVSPPMEDFVVEIVHCEIPAGVTIAYDAPALPGMEQHVWMRSGRLELSHDETTRVLLSEDCLRFRLWGKSRFHAIGPDPAIYTIVIGRRPS